MDLTCVNIKIGAKTTSLLIRRSTCFHKARRIFKLFYSEYAYLCWLVNLYNRSGIIVQVTS